MEIKSVNHYIQKNSILTNLNEYFKEYQNIALFVDPYIFNRYEKTIVQIENGHLVSDINDIQDCDAVAGIGGGKIMDQAKYAAYLHHADCILIPTIPSTDAPCTSVMVVDGKYVECGCPKKVLVDEEILAQAPIRFFISGIGDALTTYFEARHYELSATVESLTQTCLDMILKYGLQAKKDLEEGLLSEAVSKSFEAIFYLSGTGFANSGGSGAHALGKALSEKCHDKMHGELVAFGLLVQLFLENDERIHELRKFYKEISLPCHLHEIGLSGNENELLEIIADCITEMNMGMILQEDDILEAIYAVDAFEDDDLIFM